MLHDPLKQHSRHFATSLVISMAVLLSIFLTTCTVAGGIPA